MVQEGAKQQTQEFALPDKKYFKIGETSSLLGVKPHVLRYWETEFPQIRPFKSKTGQRLYRRRDVEALLKIQRLLYHERFTIAGARQALRLGGLAPQGDDMQEDVMLDVELGAQGGESLPSPASPERAHHSELNPLVHASLMAAKKQLEAILHLVEEKA
jgi:DNA-binding transcriptional MerR regulator